MSSALEDLRRAEHLRGQKQNEFLQAIREERPSKEVASIKAELDALNERAAAALSRVLQGYRSTHPDAGGE